MYTIYDYIVSASYPSRTNPIICAIRIPAMTATSVASHSILRRAVHAILAPPSIDINNNKLSYHKTIWFIPFKTRLSSSALSICHVAQATKGDVDVLAKGVGDKSTIEAVKQIIEKANRALSRREVLHTDFLLPPVLKESMLILEKLADIKAVAQGGYPQAERCRLSVGYSEDLKNVPDIVSGMSITGNFGFQPCSHGDFLGAILGTGIAREKLGDIIVQGEKGAQILIVPELVDFLTSSLDKVGNVPVSCKKIPLLALEYEPPRTKSFKTVEASLRVDAIGSAGFKISRSKLADMISNGYVRLNWTNVTKNNTTVRMGDIISISGKGRVQIGEIHPTKKGKFSVELIQYL